MVQIYSTFKLFPAFCYFYTLHGVLYEQPYEILVLVVTTVVLLIYLVLMYSESTSSDTLRAVSKAMKHLIHIVLNDKIYTAF